MIHRANDLCSKVLWARYSDRVAKGVLNATVRDSIWWRDIFNLCYEDDLGTCWFNVGVRERVGNGSATRFWKDTWCGGNPLNVNFRKLLDLSLQKNKPIINMGKRVEGIWTWSFKWRRNLSNRENLMMTDLCSLLESVPLTHGYGQQTRRDYTRCNQPTKVFRVHQWR